MSDTTIEEWSQITKNSTSQRQTTLLISTLIYFWIAGSSWVVIPYYIPGSFAPACDQVVLNIIAIITTLLIVLSVIFSKNHKSNQNVESHTTTFTGQEILGTFKSLPLGFARTLEANNNYQVVYVLIWHTDAEGDLHERYYALQVGNWKDPRKAIRFPKWVRLAPLTLSAPIILGAIFHRAYYQFLDENFTFFQKEVWTNLNVYLIFPGLCALGTIAYILHLVYFSRLIRDTPTIHAVE